MLHEQFYDTANADLFLVIERPEPSGELVGTLDLPPHKCIMP
jgi:hypothetical protein